MHGIAGSTTTSKAAAFLLIFVNSMALVCSLLLFALGVWIVAAAGTLSTLIQDHGNQTLKALFPRETLSVQLGVALAGVGLFLFIVSFMGLYGAATRSTFLLFMYAMLVLLLLLLECALLYYFTTDLKQKGLQERDGQWTHAMRLIFSCCEYDMTTLSTFLVVTKLPWSCCGPDGYPDNCTALPIYDKDCNSTINAWLSRYLSAIYTTLAVSHIVLASCSLVRRATLAVPLAHT